jgi:arylsulfatase A
MPASVTFAAASLFLFAGSPPAATAAKPNLVLLLADDLGYGDLGCFGHMAIQSPHLDKLARGGLKLTACYAAAPVCSPSRASIITGQTPYRQGIVDWIPANSGVFLKKDAPSIARLLRAAGYRTAHVGKWHLNSRMDGTEPTPGDHGFEHWFSTQNNAAPTHQNPINFFRNGKKAGPLKGNSSTLIVDEALRWLGTVKDDPFALFVWFHAPHEPIAAPEEWLRKYSTQETTKRQFCACISLMDHEIGRLLKALGERKVRDNTLVFFTSDNGPETLKRYKGAERSHGSPGPYRGMKLHLTEGGIRVPGILSWPGRIKAGHVSSEPVCGVDVLPTFCELAGIKQPAGVPCDGASFVPLFTGKAIVRRTPLYWQYDRALGPWKVALRSGRWKLLADAKLTRTTLHDLEDDPTESRNVAATQPKRARELLTAMKRLHAEVNPKKE